MQALSLQRCLHHPAREAVARCPECGRFYCRECIVEHEDRVVCADCLKRMVQAKGGKGRSRLAWVPGAAFLALGFLVAWMFFYETGALLLKIPAAFHEGTLWHIGDER